MVYHYLIAAGAVIGTIYGLKSHAKGGDASLRTTSPREWAKHTMCAVSFSERDGPRPRSKRPAKVDALESFIQTRHRMIARTPIPEELRGMDMRNVSGASDAPPTVPAGVLHEQDAHNHPTRGPPGFLSRFRRHLEIKRTLDGMESNHTSRATQWLLYEQFQRRDPWNDTPLYSEPRILAGTWPERDDWEDLLF
jgi:hypothetical protein